MSNHHSVRLISSLFLAAILSGCSEPPPPPSTPEPDQASQEIAAIRDEAASANDALLKRISALEGDLERVKQTAEDNLQECEQRVRLNDRRARDLERALKDERAMTRRLRGELEEQKAASPPIVMAPRETEPAIGFPVEIFDVAGKEVIIEVRTRPRSVETEETYRDSYGNKKPVLDWEDVPVNEYEYHTTFSARNLTDKPITIRAKAGVEKETIELAPNALVTNATLRSALGSGLLIEVSGKIKRFDVEY